MKHTPGPWHVYPRLYVGKDGGKHGYFEIGSAVSLFWVARVQGFSHGDDLQRYEANAQLIAAAPDLLEALKEVVRVVNGTLQGYGIIEPCIKQAHAAIAKAEATPVDRQNSSTDTDVAEQHKKEQR